MRCHSNKRQAHVKAGGSIAFALLLSALAIPGTAAAQVPTLNIEPSCRFQASLQSDKQLGFQKCMEQEQSAKAELEKKWSAFALEDRAHCLDMANELGGKTASYVEMLECATMLRDARALEKKFPSDMDVTIGQGSGK